jgi:hypothetical protein
VAGVVFMGALQAALAAPPCHPTPGTQALVEEVEEEEEESREAPTRTFPRQCALTSLLTGAAPLVPRLDLTPLAPAVCRRAVPADSEGIDSANGVASALMRVQPEPEATRVTRTGCTCGVNSIHWDPQAQRKASRPAVRLRVSPSESPDLESSLSKRSSKHKHISPDSFKRSSKHNHISRYTSTGRRLPARPPLGESLDMRSSVQALASILTTLQCSVQSCHFDSNSQ